MNSLYNHQDYSGRNVPTENLDDTSKQILAAASRRFLHYGYGKTTMSEIAKDCNMSTGNLYRYFPSKLDIAQMFVAVLRSEHIESLRRILEAPEKSPVEKLRGFFCAKLRLAYERFHDKPKAFELSTALLAERPKVALEWEAAERRIIADILALGDQDGSFAVGNPHHAAHILQHAMHRFTSPSVFHEGEFEELSAELTSVLDLMIDGFAWRAHRHSAS